jgi:SAM-dependent methyltransferase
VLLGASMWDERYSVAGFAYREEPNDFLREQAAVLAPRSDVLCLAEGEGRNAVFLASLGHCVHAVDLSSVGLAKAERLAAERGTSITTELADLASYDLGVARWDAVVSIWAHMPQAVRASLHARAVGALRPGGIFLLEAYTPEQLALKTGGPPVAELMMTLDGVRGEFERLEEVVAREGEREVSEGRYHQGRSATVQFLGRLPFQTTTGRTR